MKGTIVNVIAIISGGILGLLFRGRFPERIKDIVMQGISLAVILIGIQMAFVVESSTETLVLIFSLIIGGIIGELLKIEEKLDKIGNLLKEKLGNSDNDYFVQGFVQTSLIYCVGAMAIVGAIQDGLNNDPSILFTKSLLDGTTAIAFTATFGIGVIFSVLPVFFYQGGITVLAAWAQSFLRDPVVNEMTATGGLLIMAIGLNMLKVSKVKVGNLLPSIFVAIIIASIIF